MDNKKIVMGNPTTTPMRVPDFEQNDPRKSDYIKNKPFYDTTEILCDLEGVLPDENQKRAYENYAPKEGDTLIISTDYFGDKASKEFTISQFPIYVSCGYASVKLHSDGYQCYITDDGGVSVRIIKRGELVQIDEKFIPDSIARTEDVKSLINANGGNGSGGAVQADYNQNDSTQPDYIKGRPFYKERTLIVNEDLSNYEFDWYMNPIVDIRADGLLQLELNEQGYVTVDVEIEDNGTIYESKGFFTGYSMFDSYADYIRLADGKFVLQDFYDGTLQMMVNEPTTLEGVVFRVYVDTIKKIDAEYLPPNSVPYLYGEENILLGSGRVMLATLKTGAYILHGYVDTGDGNYAPDFIDKPTFVNVINDGNGRVNVYWLDTDDYAEDSVCVRIMTVVDGTLVADNTISLAEIKDGVDAAVEVAMGATSAADIAIETAVNAADAAGAADTIVSMIIDGTYYFDSISMKAADGSVYSVSVGTDGNLKATKMF